MGLFLRIYYRGVSQSFAKLAVLAVLITLSYYSRTKVQNIRQIVRILATDQYSWTPRYPDNIPRMLSYSPRTKSSNMAQFEN